MIKINIKDKIIELNKILDELDTFDEDISLNNQQIDYKISDLYHYLENNKMDCKKSYRFCKELKEILQIRREFKINVSVYSKYKQQRDKFISNKDNRKLALNNIYQEDKKIRESNYNNRVYTEDELKERIG